MRTSLGNLDMTFSHRQQGITDQELTFGYLLSDWPSTIICRCHSGRCPISATVLEKVLWGARVAPPDPGDKRRQASSPPDLLPIKLLYLERGKSTGETMALKALGVKDKIARCGGERRRLDQGS